MLFIHCELAFFRAAHVPRLPPRQMGMQMPVLTPPFQAPLQPANVSYTPPAASNTPPSAPIAAAAAAPRCV